MQGKEHLLIPGPVGSLEAEIILPDGAHDKGFIMCHPHPLYQGSMDNKVVTTLTKAMQELGFISLRFNFRGVGQSSGTYDQGQGETLDALAIISYLKDRFKNVNKWVLGGFSFGGFIAYQAAITAKPDALILISPSIAKSEYQKNSNPNNEPHCPLLVIQGDQDETIPIAAIRAWLDTRQEPFIFKEIAGASHFFHGKLDQVKQISQDYIKETLP